MNARFSTLVQTGSGAHSASPKMGTGSLYRDKEGRGVALTTNLHLVLRLKRAFTACYKVNCTFNLPFYMSV